MLLIVKLDIDFNIDIYQFQADKPSNWYNLTIKYKAEESEYGIVTNLITVYNDIGFQNYSFYIFGK